MDIDIVLGANINPRVSNETHVTKKKKKIFNFNIKLIEGSI
jgi:hypothetical protein